MNNRNPRFILAHAFGLFPSKTVRRHGNSYEFVGYVVRRGQTYVRWDRQP